MIKRGVGLKVATAVAGASLVVGAYEMGQIGRGDTYNFNYNFAEDGPDGSRAAAAPYAGTCAVVKSGVKGNVLSMQLSTNPYENTTDYRFDPQAPFYTPGAASGPDAYTARTVTISVNRAGTRTMVSETVPAVPLREGGANSVNTQATFDLGILGVNPADIDMGAITAHTDAGDVSCDSPNPDVAGLYFFDQNGVHPVDG